MSAIAAQVLGTAGAICWSVQLLPQIRQNQTRKDTTGLQPTMMLLWAAAGIPLGIYNIVRDFPLALQIQPQILTFLSLVTWAQTKYYDPSRREREEKGKKGRGVVWCVGILVGMCAVAGGIEVGIVFGLRAATERMEEGQVEYYWPVVLMGVLSAALLCAGVGRHFVDIWRERTVRGISFLFVGIDALGDLTSLISVLFWWKAGRSLDILGLVVYGSELLLWLGVFACGAWFNLRPWLRQKMGEDKQARGGMSGVSLPEQPQGLPGTMHLARVYDSTSGSISSTLSRTSGTVFRTASSRSSARDERAMVGAGHDMLRLRSIVDV